MWELVVFCGTAVIIYQTFLENFVIAIDLPNRFTREVDMAIEHAMWVHGHAVTIEQPEALQAAFYRGFMAELIGKPNHAVWVHYAIPTPVITSNTRLRVDAVMLRYRTEPMGSSVVTAIHVYDGEFNIGVFGGLGASPQWVMSRSEIPDTPHVNWGIGMSILIQFGNMVQPKFQISSVGCDFLA